MVVFLLLLLFILLLVLPLFLLFLCFLFFLLFLLFLLLLLFLVLPLFLLFLLFLSLFCCCCSYCFFRSGQKWGKSRFYVFWNKTKELQESLQKNIAGITTKKIRATSAPGPRGPPSLHAFCVFLCLPFFWGTMRTLWSKLLSGHHKKYQRITKTENNIYIYICFVFVILDHIVVVILQLFVICYIAVCFCL